MASALDCGDAVSGLNIHGVGRFLGVIGIGIVVGSTLRDGVDLVQFCPYQS